MKKRTITIAAVISTALLFGGMVLLVRDDARQAQKTAAVQSYGLTQEMQDKLDKITESLTSETVPVSSEPQETLSGTVPELDSETENIPDTLAMAEITESSVQDSSITLPAEIYHQLQDNVQSLTDAYPDAVGWLYLPDTNINYPLMQGEDNEFYLHHAYDGSYMMAGSVFLDCRCNPNFMNPINVVYAHNMKNGSMFAGVIKFKNAEYFNTHRYGWLSTADKVYRIDFFSVAVTDWQDSIYDGSQPVSDWMSRIQNLSQISAGISYDETDRFISLSTCSNEFANARTVLTGKLVEVKEE